MLYLHLLSRPRRTVAEIAEALSWPDARVRWSLDALLEVGLAARLPGTSVRYVPAAPDVAVDALVLRRQQELEQLRARTRELAQTFQQAATRGVGDLVELIEGEQALRQRIAQMQLEAQHEMLGVDCPPYLAGPAPEENPVQFQAMARGVAYRVIYHAPSLAVGDRMRMVEEFVSAGEHSRTLPSVREKMIVADRRCALMPLSFETAELEASIFIRQSPLLAALITCFEMLWERAAPLGAAACAGGTELREQDRRLLTMLSSGMKDRAIMRALGVTQRTMTRRVAGLLDALDAETRFQAGVQAARRGLL